MTFSAQQGVSLAADAAAAVAEIAAQVGGAELDVVFLFCSPRYDLEVVGRELKRSFPCPVVGCSSSGQIGPGGFQRGGMAAIGLGGGCLRVVPHLIHLEKLRNFSRLGGIREPITVVASLHES